MKQIALIVLHIALGLQCIAQMSVDYVVPAGVGNTCAGEIHSLTSSKCIDMTLETVIQNCGSKIFRSRSGVVFYVANSLFVGSHELVLDFQLSNLFFRNGLCVFSYPRPNGTHAAYFTGDEWQIIQVTKEFMHWPCFVKKQKPFILLVEGISMIDSVLTYQEVVEYSIEDRSSISRVNSFRAKDIAEGATKLGEFKSWGKGSVQRAFKNNKIFRQLTDYFRNPIVDDISNVVYDFDGRKLLEGITDNAGHYASKGEAELFIKGELKKVLLADNGAKAKELIAAMNSDLLSSLQIVTTNQNTIAESIVRVFSSTNSGFYNFIKVH